MFNNSLSILAMSDRAQMVVFIIISTITIVYICGGFFWLAERFTSPTRTYDKNQLRAADDEYIPLVGSHPKRLQYSNLVLGDNGIYVRPDIRRNGIYTYIPYNRISKYHIAYQPTTTTRSGAGGAVDGGLLFGVVGAIAGGLATRRQLNSNKELILVIHADECSSFRINFIDGERTESIIKNRITEYEQLRAYLDNHGVPYTQEVLPSLP